MEFLDCVDFENHDGVKLSMLNDVVRNQFYDKILQEVQNQHCVDIGFGTGLLSMLALKHGAQSIIAYESDHNRYLLGCRAIKTLGLQNKITLLNQKYTHDCDHTATVIFTETVDENLWGEGIYNSFPRQPGIKFLPGKYFFELHAVSISTAFALNLFASFYKDLHFSPGIDIDTKFVSYINWLLAKKYRKTLDNQNEMPTGVMNISPVLSYTPWITTESCVGQYTIDANAPFDNILHKEFTVQLDNQPMLVVPRVGMQHNGHRLYLDMGHWRWPQNPVIVNCPDSQLVVKHDLTTGKISYNIKEKQ